MQLLLQVFYAFNAFMPKEMASKHIIREQNEPKANSQRSVSRKLTKCPTLRRVLRFLTDSSEQLLQKNVRRILKKHKRTLCEISLLSSSAVQ